MKNIIILLIGILGVSVNAQDIIRKIGNDGVLKVDNYFPLYSGVANDTISTNRDSLAVVFFANKPQSMYYDFQAKITDVSIGGKCTTRLQGKKFEADSWSTITTQIYYGGGTDTTINFSQTSTKQFYNQYRYLIVYLAGKTKLNYFNGALKY